MRKAEAATKVLPPIIQDEMQKRRMMKRATTAVPKFQTRVFVLYKHQLVYKTKDGKQVSWNFFSKSIFLYVSCIHNSRVNDFSQDTWSVEHSLGQLGVIDRTGISQFQATVLLVLQNMLEWYRHICMRISVFILSTNVVLKPYYTWYSHASFTTLAWKAPTFHRRTSSFNMHSAFTLNMTGLKSKSGICSSTNVSKMTWES